MTEVRVVPIDIQIEHKEKRVTVDNVPDIGDATGMVFLENLGRSVDECRKLIEKGYRLTSFWTDPDVGMEFILKKEIKNG